MWCFVESHLSPLRVRSLSMTADRTRFGIRRSLLGAFTNSHPAPRPASPPTSTASTIAAPRLRSTVAAMKYTGKPTRARLTRNAASFFARERTWYTYHTAKTPTPIRMSDTALFGKCVFTFAPCAPLSSETAKRQRDRAGGRDRHAISHCRSEPPLPNRIYEFLIKAEAG